MHRERFVLVGGTDTGATPGETALLSVVGDASAGVEAAAYLDTSDGTSVMWHP